MRKLLFTLGLLICAASTFAQFTVDGQYVARTEVRDGFKTPIKDNQKPAIFTEQRTRLITGYKMDKLAFKLSLQDVRIWGETGQVNKTDQSLSVHEAYADYVPSEKSTLRIGRQEVIYDDARFFGNLDWAMQARSLDAVRYMYKGESTQFHVMASWNQGGIAQGIVEPTKLTGNTYTPVTGANSTTSFNLGLPQSQLMAYYKKTFSKGDLAIMALKEFYSTNDSTSYGNYTIGLTPNFVLGKVKVGGQFYYTGGTAGKVYANNSYSNVDLSGYMFNAYLQLPSVKGAPLVGIDYLSGDDASTTDKVEGWNPAYGTNHKFYGYMDYFYVGNGHGGVNEKSAGLMDIYLKTNFKVSDKVKLMADFHYFASTADRTNATNKQVYKGMLGTELDLTCVVAITKEIELKAGYSQMFGITETMKQLKFSDPNASISGMQNWTYVMINFTPKFL